MAGTTNSAHDKLSIKSMLFTRAIPTYVIPVPTEGHKIYSCTDCGDRFLLKSSYEFHINRQSVKITYMCRYCDSVIIFKNRCNLLSHIRGHAFKTATINVSDLKVEPLPLTFKSVKGRSHQSLEKFKYQRREFKKANGITICYECHADISSTGVMCKDKANHYMRHTNELYSCPICLFVMPTTCALSAHMRIHLKVGPCCCPECGIFLTTKNMDYPFNHHTTKRCEGFNMMRATARVVCPIKQCNRVLHPSQYVAHIQSHLVRVFKCSSCVVACLKKEDIETHTLTHPQTTKPSFAMFYRCDICSGRLVQLDTHLIHHANACTFTYPCWNCNVTFPTVPTLLSHIKDCPKKNTTTKDKETNIQTLINPPAGNTSKETLYRVVKRCDQCKLVFTYRCRQEDIASLPNDCPDKCSPGHHVMEVSRTQQVPEENSETLITCHICRNKISMDWNDIKIHYDRYHKQFRCADVKIVLNRQDVTDYYKQKKKRVMKQIGVLKKKLRRRNKNLEEKIKDASVSADGAADMEVEPQTLKDFICIKCNLGFDSKQALEEHVVSHRDPCTAYQCLECGECFVVKPSFSTHLLLKHNISEVDEYVATKTCFNEQALVKHYGTNINQEPLRENQCNICRDQFDNQDDLEKHYRVHGMAFLMKKTLNKNTSPEK